MKKLIFLAALIIFTASFCLAQQPQILPPDLVLPVPMPSLPASEPTSPPPVPAVTPTPATTVTPPPVPTVPPLPPVEPPKSIEIKSIAGKVESVSLADAEKGTRPEMLIIDDKGEKIAFLTIATTTIYDAAWKRITLDKIKSGDRVNVKYMTTNEGLYEARTINIMK